jgi:hypothetical protein
MDAIAQRHSTVLLSSDFSPIYKPFHCSNCGNIVFSYNEDEVRTILPGGNPQLNRPGKIIQCHGIMKLRSTASIYDVLYKVMEIAMNMDNVEDIRTAVAAIAQGAEKETNVRCKMLWFVS